METRRSIVARALVIILVGIVSACGEGGETPAHPHANCSYSYNSHWGQTNFLLVHSDGRDCPLAVDVGQSAYTGGTVYDLNWPNSRYPNFPPSGDGIKTGEELQILVFDDINNGGSLLGSFTNTFGWGFSRDPFASPPWEWQSGGSVGYSAGASPDYALFSVEIDELPFGHAEALMTINYWGTQM